MTPKEEKALLLGRMITIAEFMFYTICANNNLTPSEEWAKSDTKAALNELAGKILEL